MTSDLSTDTRPEPRPGPAPDVAAPPQPPSDLAVGTIVALGLFVVYVVRHRWMLQGPILLGGDIAHQFGTAWDAVSLRELRGNGSRTGFNHPGPSYLWVWGAADALRKVLGSPIEQHNAMLIASFAFNAAQLGALTAIVRSHLRSVPRALVVLVAIIAFASVIPYVLAGSWLPEMFAASFALLVVAGASAAAGRLQSLVAYAVAAGLLLQGHIAFSSFVAIGTLVLAVTLWRSGDLGRLWRRERPTAIAAGALLAAFAAPVVGYTLLDWPGEVPEYLEWSQRPESGGHALDAAIRFVLWFWPGGNGWVQAAIAAASFTALGAVAWWRRSRFGWCVLVATALAEACLLLYVLTGLDDIGAHYVALWISVVPGIVVGTAVALALGDRLVAPASRRARVAVGAVTATAVAVAVLVAPSTDTRFLRFEEAFGLVDRIQTEIGDRMLVLDLPTGELDSYWFTPALVSVALDRGVDVCFVEERWSIKYTPDRVCTDQELRDGLHYSIYSASLGPPQGVDPATLQPYASVFVVPGPRVSQPPG